MKKTFFLLGFLLAASAFAKPTGGGLQVLKGCPQTPVGPGDSVVCTFTVTNRDLSAPVQDLVLSDVFNGGAPTAPLCYANVGLTGDPVDALAARGQAGDTCYGSVTETAPGCLAIAWSPQDHLTATADDIIYGTVTGSALGFFQEIACTPTPSNTPTPTPSTTLTFTPTLTPTPLGKFRSDRQDMSRRGSDSGVQVILAISASRNERAFSVTVLSVYRCQRLDDIQLIRCRVPRPARPLRPSGPLVVEPTPARELATATVPPCGIGASYSYLRQNHRPMESGRAASVEFGGHGDAAIIVPSCADLTATPASRTRRQSLVRRQQIRRRYYRNSNCNAHQHGRRELLPRPLRSRSTFTPVNANAKSDEDPHALQDADPRHRNANSDPDAHSAVVPGSGDSHRVYFRREGQRN